MPFVYILRSMDGQHWYTGYTENIEKRIKKHNSSGTAWTKKFKPWDLVHKEFYESEEQARKRERFLKSKEGYLEYREIKESVSGGVA